MENPKHLCHLKSITRTDVRFVWATLRCDMSTESDAERSWNAAWMMVLRRLRFSMEIASRRFAADGASYEKGKIGAVLPRMCACIWKHWGPVQHISGSRVQCVYMAHLLSIDITSLFALNLMMCVCVHTQERLLSYPQHTISRDINTTFASERILLREKKDMHIRRQRAYIALDFVWTIYLIEWRVLVLALENIRVLYGDLFDGRWSIMCKKVHLTNVVLFIDY